MSVVVDLHPAVERRLLVEAKAGPGRARDQLIQCFAPLVAHAAARYRYAGRVERSELCQEGVIGLLRALERFDPDQGTPFWAYATWWVRQAMRRVVAELARPVVLPDHATRELARVRATSRRLTQAHGREPAARELEAETGLTRHQIERLVTADAVARSLHEPVSADGGAGTLGDLVVDARAEEAYEGVQRRLTVTGLGSLLGALTVRERTVVLARFGLDGPEESRRELGERLGLSAERVRQIEVRALYKLRAACGLRGAPDQEPSTIEAKTM
jgi:RNA polymerase sigma factor (sigma-70 family)